MRMTARVHIDEFQPEYEDIEAYLEWVDLYFLAGSTKEADKVPLFLTVVGKKNYTLLRDLVALVKPREKDLATLYEKLRKQYQTKKVVSRVKTLGDILWIWRRPHECREI